MNEDKWKDILANVTEKFGIEEEKTEPIEERGGGTRHSIVFTSPVGRMKLERTIRPVVLDKKTTYSRRIGSGVSVEYVFSEDETIDKISAYRWNNGSWEEFKGFTL